jgi:multisubunit Na+/H+ antiporter MnhC subunit
MKAVINYCLNPEKTKPEENASGVCKTGWEAEQGIYFSGATNGQTRKGNVLDKPNLLSVPSRSGVLLAGTAGLISTMGTGNDGKTPEEREAEERAREASGNFAAALTLTAVGISLALKKAHTEEENLENENEIESDNEQEMKL